NYHYPRDILMPLTLRTLDYSYALHATLSSTFCSSVSFHFFCSRTTHPQTSPRVRPSAASDVNKRKTEANDERQEHIRHNRDALGVPTLHLVAGSAPEALLELPEPDAIFIGGGVTAEGVLETCWERLRPGGRLLANAVTLQSERVLLDWQQRLGGDLTRLGVAHARPLGGFDTWRQALPITLLELRKPAARKPPRDA
uniref:bifunctional cobalt-precorrin-7 (C(5))-methyltransferase/cobalt-precorrin-6B (C(15))-methyltransferase n=1 Tax=Pseudomonas aeruginosa TaxID=287 RepID=UPI0020B10727